MDQKIIAKMEAQVNVGISLLKEGKSAEAGNLFQDALEMLEDVEDPASRRKELSVLSTLFHQLGFYDLALLGATDAVELDKQLGDDRQLAEDLLTCGNVHMNLGNTERAIQAYQTAFDISEKRNDYDNAASALTNMAMLVANSGDMPKGIEMLKKSLGYLAQVEHPETEIITRVTLIQALDIQKSEPELIVEQGRVLLQKFGSKIPPDQRKVIEAPLKRAIDAHLKANPTLKRAEWLANNFPAMGR